MKDKLNFRSFIALVLIAILIILLTCFLGLVEKFYLDEYLCLFYVNIIFYLLFLYEIEYERNQNRILFNTNTSFNRVVVGIAICEILIGSFVFLPEFCKPVMIIPIVMYSLCNNSNITFIVSLYLEIVLAVGTGCSYFEILTFTMLIMVGAIIAKSFISKRKIFMYILVFCINIITPELMAYCSSKEYDYLITIYGSIIAIVTVISLYFFGEIISKDSKDDSNNMLIDIITDDYSQVQEVKSFSSLEYTHAQKVSEIAYKCAKVAGLNPNLCAAAGFYYRLGKWIGDDYVNEGIKRALELCFPTELVVILSEYYGEENSISTPESATVHMIDALIKKFEILQKDVKNNQWNKELIIYQTLNEFSSTGIYDNSGLCMNQFLKIREYLAKEDISL